MCTHDPRDPCWPQPSGLAQRHDAPFQRNLRGLGTVMRPAGPILESGDAFFAIATPPHVRAITRNTHRRGRMRDRPTTFDALTQTKTPFGRQRSVTVHEKPPLRVGCLLAPHSPGGFIHPRTPSATSVGTTASCWAAASITVRACPDAPTRAPMPFIPQVVGTTAAPT